jgi:hypothetical protein
MLPNWPTATGTRSSLVFAKKETKTKRMELVYCLHLESLPTLALMSTLAQTALQSLSLGIQRSLRNRNSQSPHISLFTFWQNRYRTPNSRCEPFAKTCRGLSLRCTIRIPTRFKSIDRFAVPREYQAKKHKPNAFDTYIPINTHGARTVTRTFAAQRRSDMIQKIH